MMVNTFIFCQIHRFPESVFGLAVALQRKERVAEVVLE